MMLAIYSAHTPKPSEMQQKIQYGVPDYKAFLYASVLEETLMELYCLDKLNTHLRLQSLMFDIKYLKFKKYHLEQHLDEHLNLIDPTRLDCTEYKLNKLIDDRKLIIKVLQDTYMNLKNERTFRNLGNYVLSNKEYVKYCRKLVEDEQQNRIKQKEVYKRLRLQRRHNKKDTLATDSFINNLTIQLEDQELTEAVRSRYVDGWQRARTSQHLQVISDIEGVPRDKLYNYKTRIDDELIVHSNINLHLQIAIKDILHQIERWMDKFDKDMEDIDLKIQIKKHDYHTTKIKKTTLEEKLADREKEMTAWVTFKAEREKIRLYREKMINSAVMVQSWWRGLLVRKHLGLYRIRRTKKNIKTAAKP